MRRDRTGAVSQARLTLHRPLSNPSHVGWFSRVVAMRGNNWECDGWTHIGHPYRSRPRDCRTVRVRHPAQFASVARDCMGQSEAGRNGAEKPLAWHRDQPGWTPLLLRIVRLSRCSPQRRASETTRKGLLWHRKDAGKARRTARVLSSRLRLNGRGDAGLVTP